MRIRRPPGTPGDAATGGEIDVEGVRPSPPCTHAWEAPPVRDARELSGLAPEHRAARPRGAPASRRVCWDDRRELSDTESWSRMGPQAAREVRHR